MYPRYIQNIQEEIDPLHYLITETDLGIFSPERNSELKTLMQKSESFEIRYILENQVPQEA